MEDILSSIKRIISEEGEPAARPKRAAPRSAAMPPQLIDADDDHDEVLELSTPVPEPTIRATAIPAPQPQAQRASAAPEAAASGPEPLASLETAEATRGALDALSRLLVRPEPGNDGTLEGLVREMLRPMLRTWIDTNLPPMVEGLVAREIAKITGSAR